MDQSLEQLRAAHAWKCVQGQSKDYANLAKGAPALVMSNGLMQTLAFFTSKGEGKGKAHHTDLCNDVLQWLCRPEACGSYLSSPKFDEVMDKLSRGTSDQYLRATQEALAILRWIRQLAVAALNSRGQ